MMTTAIPAWALVNGTWTLPNTGIEIRTGEPPDMPFTLHCPLRMPLPYWTLEMAKSDGEKCAADMRELGKQPAE